MEATTSPPARRLGRAVGYCRVSTEEQAREGHSLDGQRAKITAYATVKDLDLIDIVVDAGVSAKDLNRPGMQRVLALLQRGEAESLVVYKLDRLTRSTKDLLALVYDTLIPLRISLHSITETLDTTTANGRFFLTMLGAMATWERETIRERTRDALRAKASKGEWSGRVPFGFRIDGAGKLVRCEEAQRAIQRAKRLRRDGHSIEAVARRVGVSAGLAHKLITTDLRQLTSLYAATCRE